MTDNLGVTVRMELEGNFFTHDPGKTLYRNIGDMMEALSHELGDLVTGDIQAHAGGMPNYTGWTAEHTYGYVVSPKTGKHWKLWAAVRTVTQGMGKGDAIRTKAAMSTIEARWHPYRRARSAVYRSRALLSANLTKDLE